MRVVLLAAVVWAVAVVPAGAATVNAEGSCDEKGIYCSTRIAYAAAPGEVNALTVTHDDASVTLTDAVAIQAGKGCTAIAGGVRCATPPDAPLGGLTVKLSDRDDVASLDVTAAVYGGPGNDRITGSGLISGGPGADELIATTSTSFIDDDGPRPAADRYIGSAAGSDSVSYAGRTTDVDIDLRRSANAGDVFTSIERAEGGDGDDRLVGTDGPNQLVGGPGDDRLIGLAGNDELKGNGQESTLRARPVEHDRLFGGAGNDVLAGGEALFGGAGDDSLDGGTRLECGPGRDKAMTDSGAFAFVRRDCEELASVGNVSDLKVHAPPAHAFLTNPTCYCRYAHYTASTGGVVVARASMRHKHVGYHHWPLALRLNAQGRRLLAARGRLRITVRIYERYEVGYGASHERFRTDLVPPT
jgi:hypothetical protein